MAKSLDLLAIGRSSVDLYGQQIGCRLEDMSSFAKYVGGSPTNTAVGLARLGLQSALLTRVGDDHMGRFIREQLARDGVDVRGVLTDPDRLTALVILGIRDRERFPLIFFRENCADMALCVGDVDDQLAGSAKAVLINGTHLSRPSVFEASVKAASIARETGGRVVLDIDYRPVLWGLTGRDRGEDRFVDDAAVTGRLQEVLPLCDLVVGTEEEIHILGGSTDTLLALQEIRRRTDALLVCKLGPRGCVAFPGPIPGRLEDGVFAAGFRVDVFNVLGAGDAFMAGLLSGWLRDEPLQRSLQLANACGAIVVSRHGCAPAMPTKRELESFLMRDDLPKRLRDDVELEHIHWATTRRRRPSELTILAVDHRAQFDDLMAETGCPEERVVQFKQLAFRALRQVAGDDPLFGVLLDGRFGFDALAEAADHPYWIGRPIELPKSRPIEFEGSADVGLELLEWPATHVVKCLVYYHADDEADVRDRQDRQLVRLFDACRKTGHELLLEIIAPAGAHIDGTSTAESIRRIYALGVRPDWWKLEPSADVGAWENIVSAIDECDPFCRGILLLGLSAPVPELIASFKTAARFPLVRGFAVGRTIFHDVAKAWLPGAMSDDDAVRAMAGHLDTLVKAWRGARLGVEAAA